MTSNVQHDVPHTAHAEPNYMAVFVALTVMTVAEVGVAMLHVLPYLVIAALLVIFAFAKAIVVAAYFMHLKFEKRTLALIAGVPIVLCIFLLIMLKADQPYVAPASPAPVAPAAH
jgi:cytochrome c oxidase subunit 4